MVPDDLTDMLVPLVERAGKAILEVYESGFSVEEKADRSPVTAADRAAHDILAEGLREQWPDIPVLSEEGADVAFETRRSWSRFFLVDPLDGTKEFIRRNGDFTVNVALVEEGRPVAGVVGLPAHDAVFGGTAADGAFRIDAAGPVPISVQDPPREEPLRVVASRSHRDAETEAFLERLPPHETLSCGSSLKICRVAEGAADLYPRFGPTMEWDTAAAHAVLLAAGGRVVSARDGRPLEYNKEDLHNPGFIATGPFDPSPYLS